MERKMTVITQTTQPNQTTNSLIQRGRTYGELLTELRARLSFVAQGPSAANNAAVLGSILREAHDTVYTLVRPSPMRKKTTIILEQGSHRYDWHNDIEDQNIDPYSVLGIWIIAPDGTTRHPLTQGIPETCWQDTSRGRPTRFDTLNGQIQLHPIPDKPYGLLIEYHEDPPRFCQDADRTAVNHRLVLLYAIYLAKSHYHHTDANVAMESFRALLARHRAEQHQLARYYITPLTTETPSRATVTSTATGYTYRNHN